MKKLTYFETSQISGGEQFLILTSTLETKNIPNACIEQFFNPQSNMTLVGLTEENLTSSLIDNCSAYKAPIHSWLSPEAWLEPFSLSIIEA